MSLAILTSFALSIPFVYPSDPVQSTRNENSTETGAFSDYYSDTDTHTEKRSQMRPDGADPPPSPCNTSKNGMYAINSYDLTITQ